MGFTGTLDWGGISIPALVSHVAEKEMEIEGQKLGGRQGRQRGFLKAGGMRKAKLEMELIL